MRKKSFLLAAMTAVLISSCTHDAEIPVTDGSTATLKLTVSGASAVTRATGAALPTSADENVITNVTVGLFDHATGKTDAIKEGSLNSGKIEVKGTAGDRDIIVVANAPTGKFAGALTMDEFRKRALSLTQVKTLLPMSGESAAPVTLVGGDTEDASVEVSRLVARIQITSLKTDFSTVGQYANASFTLDKVFLYNAMSTSQAGILSTETALVTKDLIHGWEGPNEGIATANTGLVDKDINALIPAASSAYTTPYYFYAFQNYFAAGIDNTNKGTATKLVVSGWFTPDAVNAPGTKFYVYYPAVINRAQTGTDIVISDGSAVSNKGIVRNSIYSVAATIKSIGVDSPEKFMEPAGLNLTVTIADWKFTASQAIEF